MEKPEEKRKEVLKKKPAPIKKPIPAQEPEKKLSEISEESLAERQLLDKMFSAGADAQADSDKRRRKARAETIVLLDGRETSLDQIHARFVATPQLCSPLFPNSDPFFAQALRIHGLGHIDPKVYVKPSCIREFVLRTIYSRFPKSKELLRAIRTVNPLLPNGFRLYKLYYHVDEQGKADIERFRDDTTRIMEKCTTDYECNKRLYTEHGVSYQTDVFKEESGD